jgi:acyl-coenzyme A thioesterase 9
MIRMIRSANQPTFNLWTRRSSVLLVLCSLSIATGMNSFQMQCLEVRSLTFGTRHHFMIFGGFLLKQTFELAFCCAASFAHSRPTFVSLDPSTFQNPVPVGSVLYLTATVVYTDPPLVSGQTDEDLSSAQSGKTRVQVRVDSKVRDVEHGETKPTGQFNYTFTVDQDVKVMPRSYTEFMMYTDARRRARRVLETVKEGKADGGGKDRVTE